MMAAYPALRKAGGSLQSAIEKFTTVAETIAKEYPEIKAQMDEALCHARSSGIDIENVCNLICASGNIIQYYPDFTSIIMAAKILLSSITRILLLVDIIIVKKLLIFKPKTAEISKDIASIVNFVEFIKSFSGFAFEMTELGALLTRNCGSKLKQERRQMQMAFSRQILEHLLKLLVTSSKNCLAHRNCTLARENRDTVFCQIRRAMDLIHFVLKDAINDDSEHYQYINLHKNYAEYDNDSLCSTIKYLIMLLESEVGNRKVKSYQFGEYMQNVIGENSTAEYDLSYLEEKFPASYPISNSNKGPQLGCFQNELTDIFMKINERLQDFTDSFNVSDEYREVILKLSGKCGTLLTSYLNKYCKGCGFSMEVIKFELITSMINCLTDLNLRLKLCVLQQIPQLKSAIQSCVTFTNNIFNNHSVRSENSNAKQNLNNFFEYCDFTYDICKLLQHVTPTESMHVKAKHLSQNLRIFGPQLLTAAKIRYKYSNSKIAQQNFEAFSDMWVWLAKSVYSVAEDVNVTIRRPSSVGILSKPANQEPNMEVEESKSYLDLEGHENNPQTDARNNCNNENDILNRAKNMSNMAFLMYQFTKGYGALRTTQDLFTQAEYFAEEANRLYKVIRHFSYQVPACEYKKDLATALDVVPIFVQTLQFTVKDYTVGQDATYIKVDHVIKETKNLMAIINKVVENSIECAKKFNLNFSAITGGFNEHSALGDENSTYGMTDSKCTSSTSEGNM